MMLKTYDFSKYDTIYVPDGNGGFDTVDKKQLENIFNEVLVVERNGVSHFEWTIDGQSYKDFYIKNDYGNMQKLEPDFEQTVVCCVYNEKSETAKSFSVEYDNGLLQSTCELSGYVTESGDVTSIKVTVLPGRYFRQAWLRCRDSFMVDKIEVYSDEAHAAWYHTPTIDNVRETPRADLVRLDKMEKEALESLFNGLKNYAQRHNIKLFVDEYSGDVRAVKVPDGYNVIVKESDYSKYIPWELMPVIGTCNATINSDSYYQPTLEKESANG